MTSRSDPSAALVQQPDEMGVWNDGGDVVWLPRILYPHRLAAIKWAMEQWGVTLPEVRCLSRWMRWEPFVAHNLDGSVAWQEDQWWECEGDADGAFRVWRLESA